VWRRFHDHVIEEERAEKAWRSNRLRRPHQGTRGDVPPWGSHALCLTHERDWRSLLSFLARQRAG
jgi:hypothetical protein